MRQTFLSLAICLILFSCKKHASDNNSIWQCNSPQNLDSTAISNKIVGSWNWTKRSLPTGKVIMADKDIKVTFNSNGTFTVLENSSIIAQGNWKLKIITNNMWGLDLTSPSDYLYGFILFCINQVLFTDGYRDGYNNLFEKAN